MTKQERLKLKEQSLVKWEGVVKLCKQMNTLSLDHESCGYCKLYYIYYNDNDDIYSEKMSPSTLCSICPLSKANLCLNGSGFHYKTVLNGIFLNDRPKITDEVINSAQVIVDAIKEDIAKGV